jgi:hypothetical protein
VVSRRGCHSTRQEEGTRQKEKSPTRFPHPSPLNFEGVLVFSE